MRLLSNLVMLGILASFPTLVETPSDAETLSVGKRLKDLEALCDAIARIHPSLEYKGVDIKGLKEKFKERIKVAKSDEEFYGILERLMEEIGDSHTSLVSIPVKRKVEVSPATRPKDVEIISHKWVGNRIGYIRISFFGRMEMDEFIERFDDALEEFRESRGLVIDVRKNPGGSDGLANMVNGRFIKEPVVSGIAFWREEGTDTYKKGVGLVMPREAWTYEKPVAVLIDGGCESACEHFVSGAEATGRMLLVGTPTAGSSGGPKAVTLPSGAVVRISRAIGFRANGIVFEGHGIPPHIEVKPKVGSDIILETAVKVLEKWIKKGKTQLPLRYQVIDSKLRKFKP